MSATKILWGQITVFALVLIPVWGATQWTAWRLGFQPQLGHPGFELWLGIPVYVPPAFFWWWYAYDPGRELTGRGRLLGNRWLIRAMVPCCSPLAIALTAAAAQPLRPPDERSAHLGKTHPGKPAGMG
jgi:type IV secretory pathway TraG/TraD family ATPase VirD4